MILSLIFPAQVWHYGTTETFSAPQQGSMCSALKSRIFVASAAWYLQQQSEIITYLKLTILTMKYKKFSYASNSDCRLGIGRPLQSQLGLHQAATGMTWLRRSLLRTPVDATGQCGQGRMMSNVYATNHKLVDYSSNLRYFTLVDY